MSMFGLPMGAQMAPQALGAVPAPQPFVWGAGGAQLTPDQLEAKQRIAAQLSQPDYSPVSSVYQGLGRFVNNIEGALQTKKLDKQQAAMGADQQRIIAALTSSGDHSAAVNAAYGSGSPAAIALADKVFALDHPKPVNNDTANDFNFYSQQLGPEAGQTFLHNQLDPIVTIPLPGGSTYVGPRSGMQAALGGGDPSSPQGAVPAAPVGKLTPIGGGPTQPASAGFR
jgi:hypothetical protein